MARKVNARPVGVVYEFIPTAFDNDKDSEPIVVKIKPITEKAKRAITIAMATRNNDSAIIDTVKDQVVEVENYTDANGRPIRNGRDLWEHGESEIVGEVAQEIVFGGNLQLGEDSKKNSES